ncbi:MAG: ATP-binding protein [Paracoccus sp. (in: a-proteobacteria)]|uniref:hybrid sensor histidine kinase/response regulator n=1 Tax=Paracoccus sp. TaxID=267 RepID=UPI0026DF3C87|nr:ATP-binding protein [Paracoccus sp. (in: a-proteobacteria)]MDO5621942.1 ATP-binding protein [Paracoccus sp. (in: a-proteobacteria)]
MLLAERLDSPPSRGYWLLPVLMLPAVVGGLLLMVMPDLAQARFAVLATVVACAWYALGGVLSIQAIWRAQRQRRRLKAMLPGLMDVAEPAWLLDRDGRVFAQNPSAEQQFSDLTGRPLALAFGQQLANPDAEIPLLARRAGASLQAQLMLADGARLTACRMDEDGTTRLILTAAEAGRGVESDFDLLPVALLRLSPEGRITASNKAATPLVGVLEGEPLLSDLFDGLGRPVTDWVAEVLRGHGDGRAEVLHRRRSQDQHLRIALSRSSDGLLAVLSDTSELRTLEAQFVQSQKMQAIGQLAGGVAHDFNNLLTAISGHCDLLMLRHDKHDPDYADLDQISQNANRAASLVGQLLAFSRKQTLKPAMLDLCDIMADLTHLLNRLVGERVSLTLEHDPGLSPVRADRRQLEQVIMNLVVNARDAMPMGGQINIRTENAEINNAQGAVKLPQGQYVRVSVSDNGCGMSAEVAEKIFEPFFTTKKVGEGTGLGLSTAYGIVKQTGGYIFCDSTPGQGTRFDLLFPAQSGQIEPPAVVPPPAMTSSGLRTGRLLLVEDEAPVRAFASRALRLKGFEVVEAENAEVALQILQDDRMQFDGFLTDVVMPGLDGPSWVRRALRDRPNTPVIFMSGYAEDVFSNGNHPVPNAIFLAKPFSLADLVATVSQHFGSDQPAVSASVA